MLTYRIYRLHRACYIELNRESPFFKSSFLFCGGVGSGGEGVADFLGVAGVESARLSVDTAGELLGKEGGKGVH